MVLLMFEWLEELFKDKKKKKKFGGKLYIKLKEVWNLFVKDVNGFLDFFCKRYFYVKYNNEYVYILKLVCVRFLISGEVW